jgi:hypothetical protein
MMETSMNMAWSSGYIEYYGPQTKRKSVAGSHHSFNVETIREMTQYIKHQPIFASGPEVLPPEESHRDDEGKEQKEERARVVYESMAPYSHSFTIYSVGQALEINTVAGETITNVLGEVRNKTQVEFNPATGRVQPVYTEPILPAD